jgi:hypothetical protein
MKIDIEKLEKFNKELMLFIKFQLKFSLVLMAIVGVYHCLSIMLGW